MVQGFWRRRETKAAFVCVRELADGVGSEANDTLPITGLWASSAMQCDFTSALDIARESLLQEAESEQRQPEAIGS